MKQQILDAALFIAARKGFQGVTRIAVARRAGAAEGTVSYHYKTMTKLHDAVVTAAIQAENIAVVAQAIALGHRLSKVAPQSLKDRVAKFLTA